MSRTYALTGAASGIGRATKMLLEERGHRVIGIDLHDADVEVDLSTREGRRGLHDAVSSISGGEMDAIIAVAGVAAPASVTAKVNYFGARSTLELLRPLLGRSEAPRAVVVSSFAALDTPDDELLAAFRMDDEDAAVRRSDELSRQGQGNIIYPSSKRAIAEWVRQASVGENWAGAGIPLNAVGPGVIVTPMTAPYLQTEEGRAQMLAGVPMPLAGPAEPVVVARLLAWLASEENTHVTGQIVFVDGGADVSVRGPRVFD